jgi:hypothetical protein
MNLKEITILHYCVRDSNIVLASRILKILMNQPINSNVENIKDILPNLMTLCPYSLSKFLDSRLLKVPWTPTFSDGKLKLIEGDTFAIG